MKRGAYTRVGAFAQVHPGTVIKEIAGRIDLLPTLADMTNVELVSEKPLLIDVY